MTKTLSYFSVFFGLVGTILLALDIVKPVYLKAIRKFLFDFSIAVKKTKIIPRDKRVTAHKKTVWQFLLSGNKPENMDFKDAYLENLKAMNYEPDLNLNFQYRSFVYGVTAFAILAIFVFVCYRQGFGALFSLNGLKIVGLFAIVNIGLIGAWCIDWITEMIGHQNTELTKLPPLYKITIFRRHTDIPMIIFSAIQILTNIIAKIIGKIITLTLILEKYTVTDQAPRVLGIFFLVLAFFLQFMTIVVAK